VVAQAGAAPDSQGRAPGRGPRTPLRASRMGPPLLQLTATEGVLRLLGSPLASRGGGRRVGAMGGGRRRGSRGRGRGSEGLSAAAPVVYRGPDGAPRHRGARSSVSQRLVGLLLSKVGSPSLAPSEPQAGGEDHNSSSSQQACPPCHTPNGLTLDANGVPVLNGASAGTDLGQNKSQSVGQSEGESESGSQSGGPEWQREWGGLPSDARILVELQHLGLGDCVQAVSASYLCFLGAGTNPSMTSLHPAAAADGSLVGPTLTVRYLLCTVYCCGCPDDGSGAPGGR